MSRLGRLYNRVLKVKSKGLEYYRQAMNLALSLHPRTFNNEVALTLSSQIKRS
jgi:hypothetical protein